LDDQIYLDWLEIWYACPTLMVLVAVQISWEYDERYFGFGVDLFNECAAVFSIHLWVKMWNLVAI